MVRSGRDPAPTGWRHREIPEHSMSDLERLAIADEIIRRIDTVTLATPDEVRDIRKRALTGEFDTIFDDEKSGQRRERR